MRLWKSAQCSAPCSPCCRRRAPANRAASRANARAPARPRRPGIAARGARAACCAPSRTARRRPARPAAAARAARPACAPAARASPRSAAAGAAGRPRAARRPCAARRPGALRPSDPGMRGGGQRCRTDRANLYTQEPLAGQRGGANADTFVGSRAWCCRPSCQPIDRLDTAPATLLEHTCGKAPKCTHAIG